MTQVDALQGLLRRLQVNKELTDALVYEVLEKCSPTPFDEIAEKYDLAEHCSYAAWEQAALWVLARTHPDWVLQLEIDGPGSRARLLSRHAPPFTVERTNTRLATALLEAVVMVAICKRKMGL